MSDMKSRFYRNLYCCLILLLIPAFAFAQPATEPSDVGSQVQELRSDVQDLRSRLDAQSTAVIPTTRPAAIPFEKEGLLGLHAGWNPDKGFIIRSEDDSFLLHPWVFLQFRDATVYRSEASATEGAGTENGFELPRMKLILDGNIVSRDLTYQFIWATQDTSGDLQLQDAWGRYHIPGTSLAVEGGQIRNPLDHEQYLFATKSLTPDRSIVNNILLNGDDIVKGIELSCGYDDDSEVRGLAAFTSGQRNFDTDFEEYPVNDADWGTAGRIEWKALGNWKDYTQFTALGDRTDLLVFGGGLDYTEAGAAAALTHVVDVQYDCPSGASVYAAYLGRYTRDNAGAVTTNGEFTSTSTGRHDTYDTTARFMLAQLMCQRFEPFFRYEYIQFDPNEIPAGLNSTVNDFTLGCNYYFYGQRAKLSGDVSYLPNGSPVSNTISDLMASHRGNELIVQLQFQLML